MPVATESDAVLCACSDLHAALPLPLLEGVSENSRLGFRRKNVVTDRDSTWSKTDTALGIAPVLRLEGIRPRSSIYGSGSCGGMIYGYGEEAIPIILGGACVGTGVCEAAAIGVGAVGTAILAYEYLLRPWLESRNDRLKREWEKANGQPWPTDPAGGRSQDLDHIQPTADEGAHTVDNARPLPHADHVERHKKAGDFKRWGGRRGPKP